MILDLTKCHDPSPEYLASLAYYEVSVVLYEGQVNVM